MILILMVFEVLFQVGFEFTLITLYYICFYLFMRLILMLRVVFEEHLKHKNKFHEIVERDEVHCDQCQFKSNLEQQLNEHINKSHKKLEKDCVQCDQCKFKNNSE